MKQLTHKFRLWIVCGLMTAPWSPTVRAATTPSELNTLTSAAATYESGQSLETWRRLESLAREATTNTVLRSQLETGLAKILQAPATYDAKRLACQQLAIIGSDRSLPAIAELLKNNETVDIACLALSTHPSVKANEILRHALPNLSGSARVQVINTLGDRRDAKSVELLSALTRDPEAATAEAAIVSLGKIGNQAAARVIAELRKTSRPALDHAVVESSLRLAQQRARSGDRKNAVAVYEDLSQPGQSAAVRRAALEALLRLDPDGGEQRILKVLQESDAVLKPVAIARVKSLPGRKASATFARELPKLPAQEQIWLIESLADRADKAAIEAIKGRLAPDALPAVRLAAMAALGRLGDASMVAPLALFLTETTRPEETQAAMTAMTNLRGGLATDQAIISLLKSGANHRQPIAVLAQRGSQAAVPALLIETDSPDAKVSKAAFQALGKLAKADEAGTILNKLVHLRVAEARDEAESAAAQVLAKVPNISTRSITLRTLLSQTSDRETRGSLLRLLIQAPDAEAFAVIDKACRDADARIADAALRTLAEWPNLVAWQPLMACYGATNAPYQAYHVLALRGLVRLAGEENAKPNETLLAGYRQLLSGAQNDEDRKLILGALSGVAHPEALRLAKELLKIEGIRPEAELAVKRIESALKKPAR